MLLRKRSSLVLMVALGMGAASCAGPKGADEGTDFKAVGTGDPSTDMPAPPKDAQYTIACKTFAEDAHVQDSRQAQKMLFDATKLKKWYVVHAADHSTLYYGFYRTMDPHDPTDAAEGQRAIDDQNTIRAICDSQGMRLFSECFLVPIDSPDPEANPSWDLTRVPGYWTVEIAIYKGSADRKKLAVDAVRAARNDGVEAYYYHGPNSSSVCIGSWPKEAAVELNDNTDPDAPIVVTPQPLPQSFSDSLTKQGIKSVAPHVDVVDPTLTEALHKWKEHSVNGYTMMRDAIDPVTQQHITVPERPILCKVPGRDPLDTMTPTVGNNTGGAAQPTSPDPGQVHPMGE